MSKIKEMAEQAKALKGQGNSATALNDPAYFDQSSKIISDALEKGFDVIQLENGDIVTTGTQIVTTQYRWNSEKSSMTRRTTREASNK